MWKLKPCVTVKKGKNLKIIRIRNIKKWCFALTWNKVKKNFAKMFTVFEKTSIGVDDINHIVYQTIQGTIYSNSSDDTYDIPYTIQ